MFIRWLASFLIVASSLVIVIGQAPSGQKEGTDDAPKRSSPPAVQRLRDLPFVAGIDLRFIILELARDMDLKVLFDAESFRGSKKASFELKNVTTAQALDYILLQEGLYFEQVGPKTIMVAGRFRGTWLPQIGAGVTPLSEQLAKYFGVDGGILINTVSEASPALEARLKAGDVIVEVDGVPVNGALGVFRAINDSKESKVVLTIVRDRKRKTLSVTPDKSIESVLHE